MSNSGYNPTRRHSALDFLSPLEFERQGGGGVRMPTEPAATEAVA